MDFEKLLKEFASLPKLPPRAPTFMEIAGFPHYENVCSNVLAFYFDPNREHGLKNLLLRALLDAARWKGETPHLEDVVREHTTWNNKRIDLLLQCNSLVVAVENKIRAPLNNPLDDYQLAATEVADNREVLGIVLSLWPTKAEGSGFKCITYEDLFVSIRKLWGEYITHANPHYVQLLSDFIRTIEHLKPTPMEKQEFQFYAKNMLQIWSLNESYRAFERDALALLQQFEEDAKQASPHSKWYMWGKVALVHEFRKPHHINVEICLGFEEDAGKYLITIYAPGRNSYVLNDLLPAIGMKGMGTPKHLTHNPDSSGRDEKTIIGTYDIGRQEDEVKATYCVLLRKVAAHFGMDSAPPQA